MNQDPREPVAGMKLPANVKILGLASLLNDVASEMIFPLLPSFLLTVLGGNRMHLGLIEGVADSISSLLRLWTGAWSDRIRWRKAFVVFGYTLAAVARPLAGVATMPWHLLAVRATDRVGKGIRTSPRDALIADSTDPAIRGRAFGFHQAMDHLGAATGPVLATLFLLAWPGRIRELFLVTLIPGLAVVALLIFGLQERHARSIQPPADTTASRPPLGGNFRLYLLALTLFTLGNSSDAFLLVRASELGVSKTYLPLLWCAFHLVKSGANLLSGQAADRFGPRPVLLVGWAAYGLTYIGFALAASVTQVCAIFLVYGFVYSLTEPAAKALVPLLASSTSKGLTFGWFHFAVGLTALPSSILFGWLYEQFGGPLAFGWGAALAGIASVMLLTVRMAEPEEQTSR